jgi:hypothetical protein
MAVLATIAAVVPASGANAATANTRAMWLWSRPAPAEVVEWAQAHGVREILAYTPTKPDLAWLRDLRARSAAAGIALAALGGEPAWTTQHAAALSWLAAVTATGLFDAVHVDVEPHALAAWQTDRARTAQQYVTLLEKLNAATTMRIEADVAFWYGEVLLPKKQNLADEVLRRVDAVTVMSYRDTATGPNSVTAVGADFLRRGAALGKPVRLGVETQPLTDCAYCTFAEEGAAALEGALAEIEAAGSAYASYAGAAVHSYDSWRRLADVANLPDLGVSLPLEGQ